MRFEYLFSISPPCSLLLIVFLERFAYLRSFFYLPLEHSGFFQGGGLECCAVGESPEASLCCRGVHLFLERELYCLYKTREVTQKMEHLSLQLNEAYTSIHVLGCMLFVIVVLHNLVIEIK